MALSPLATVSDLAAWIGQDISSSPDVVRADAVLSAASAVVRGYADQEWATVSSVPDDVPAIVVQVAARVFLSPPNPNIRNQTAGPFSEGYFDSAANGLYLTDEEKAALNRFRSGSVAGISTLTTTRGEIVSDTVYVPTGPPPSGYPFPWYAADGF